MEDTGKQLYLLSVGNRIKQLRESKGITLEELANRCGYTSDNARSSISKIEKGKSDIPASKLPLFAKALETTPDYILGLDNPVNIQRIQKEVEVCELFQACYGKEAFQTVALFLELDQNDRLAVTTMIQSLLSTEKYERE